VRVRAGASTSFLKKRSKKLLILRVCHRSVPRDDIHGLRNKSFLVLFFKKELLSSFSRLPWPPGLHLARRVIGA
jgi:hypothetical protein